jgi:hypothetical protein
MKVTLKMMMAIVAPSGDYIRMANMTASAKVLLINSCGELFV